jgi:hypothetical protein
MLRDFGCFHSRFDLLSGPYSLQSSTSARSCATWGSERHRETQRPALRADQPADEATIRKNAADYVTAYNNRDAKTLATFWSPDAVYVNPQTGDEAVGMMRSQTSLPQSWRSSERQN